MDFYHQFGIYLETEEGKGDLTIRAYVADVKRFRRWLDNEGLERGVPPAWETVTARHVRAYTAWLSTDRQLRKPNGSYITVRKVGAKYINRVIASLRIWFDYLVRIERLREDNPAREHKRPKIPRRNPPHLSTEELTRLINISVQYSRVPERVRNWTMVAFLFHTGLRVSELCNMLVSDIRYRDGLPQSLRVIGKGNKERRVALSAEASRALFQWLKARAEVVAHMPPGGDSEHVWLIPTGRKRGQHIDPSGVRAMLRRFGKLADITQSVHPHKLRHSFATEAVRRGAKLHGLKEMMGHSSIATTGIYLHADELELEQVAAVLPSILGGNKKAD